MILRSSYQTAKTSKKCTTRYRFRSGRQGHSSTPLNPERLMWGLVGEDYISGNLVVLASYNTGSDVWIHCRRDSEGDLDQSN